jgi:hypothetical protein
MNNEHECLKKAIEIIKILNGLNMHDAKNVLSEVENKLPLTGTIDITTPIYQSTVEENLNYYSRHQ